MLQDNSQCKLEIIDTWYRIKEEGDSLILKLRGPSMHIFKCCQLPPNLQPILQNYFPPEHINENIVFTSILPAGKSFHDTLKAKLKSFLGQFKICIPQRVKDRQRSRQIQKSLAQYCKEVKVYVKEDSDSTSDMKLYIYFPIDVQGLQARIINTLNHFERFQIFTVVYPLTQFIHKSMENELHELFVNKIAQIYEQQIKKIPQWEYPKYKYLKIKSVEAAKIQPHERSPKWHKGESRGIYGIQLIIEGLDYQLIKLYSSLQNYFAKLTYCVKNISSGLDSQTYLRKKYENRMVKYVYLSPKQYLIFGPPEYYETAAEEIEKHQWTIKMEVYPNMNFQVIKKKEKKFKKHLAQYKLVYEAMKIGQREITFVADRRNYERIKYFGREFINANIEVETRVDFIAEKHEFECLKRFLLRDNVLFDQFQLDWRGDSAYCCCADQRVKDTYNQLRENYQKCKRQMRTIISSKSIDNPLVKVTQNPDNLQPETLITRKLVSQNLQFKVNFRSFVLSPVDYAVLMLPHSKNRQQLKYILQQNCDLVLNGKLPFMQKSLQYPKQVKSFVIWNYSIGSKCRNSDIYQRRCEQILQVVYQKPQIVFLLTRQIYKCDFGSFLYLLVQIAKIELQLCGQVTILLSDTICLQEKQQIFVDISSFLQRQFSEKLKSYYSIPQEHMQIISSVKFYQMTYEYKDQDGSQTIVCSNLNAFVFAMQKSRVQRSARQVYHQVGVFLPRNAGLLEILVDLRSLKAYTIVNQKAAIFPLQKRKRLFEMAKAIKAFLPLQIYIVLYGKKDEDNGLSSLYIYQPKYKNSLKKHVLKLKDSRTYFQLQQNQQKKINFIQCDDSPIYKLQTHAKYVEELMRLLR